MITRRLFLRWLLGLPFLPLLSFPVPESQAKPLNPTAKLKENSIGRFFDGEELVYEIGFGIFKRIGLGTVTFRKSETKGQFIATAHGQTLGLVGFVTRYREDWYCTTIEEVEGGNRLRTISYEEDVKIGTRVRKTSHFFDYEKGIWTTLKQKRDGSIKRKEKAIQTGSIYDDYITASYNFRYGVYGAIERGKEYSIPTFPRRNMSMFHVTIASLKEEKRRRAIEKVKEGKEFYLKLQLDPEITDSKTGLVQGWLSKERYPLEGLVEDVLLFGDVRGTLIKVSRNT